MTAKFEVGQIYEQRHYSDYDWILRYTVESRTDKSVVLSGSHVGRLKVRHADDGSEWLMFPGSISAGSIWARHPRVAS